MRDKGITIRRRRRPRNLFDIKAEYFHEVRPVLSTTCVQLPYITKFTSVITLFIVLNLVFMVQRCLTKNYSLCLSCECFTFYDKQDIHIYYICSLQRLPIRQIWFIWPQPPCMVQWLILQLRDSVLFYDTISSRSTTCDVLNYWNEDIT